MCLDGQDGDRGEKMPVRFDRMASIFQQKDTQIFGCGQLDVSGSHVRMVNCGVFRVDHCSPYKFDSV